MSLLSKLIDRRIAAYQAGLVSTHYDEVENMYRQMRGWRHDYRNHIQVMKSYLCSGDLAAIGEYLNMLDSDLSAIDTTLKTGNKMADAILNSKISLARSKEITVLAEANIAVELTFSPMDLCIIIGNLMDNAMEACLALPPQGRFIRVYAEMKHTQLYLSLTNAAPPGKRHKIAGRFATTKGEGHGFGLARIDDIVARHSGYISRNSEEGAFSTEILLPQ